MSLTLANKITVVRILLVPVFISTVLYYTPGRDHLRYAALGVFLFAVLSDIIDGYVARHWKQQTRAGALLDPLADKCLLISAFICLYKVGVAFPVTRFPVWLVVTVISRDVILLVGSALIYMLHRGLVIEATRWGKASTGGQVVAVICMLMQWPVDPLWYMVLCLAVISGIDYIRRGIKVINQGPGQGDWPPS